MREAVAAQQRAVTEARKTLTALQKEFETGGDRVIAAAQRTFSTLAEIQTADPSLTPQIESIRATVRARVEALSAGERAEEAARARQAAASREALASRLAEQAIALNTELANVQVFQDRQLKLVADGERARILTQADAAARRVEINAEATRRIQSIESSRLAQETDRALQIASIRAAGIEEAVARETAIAQVGLLQRQEEIRRLELQNQEQTNALLQSAEQEHQQKIDEIHRAADERRNAARREAIESGIALSQSVLSSALSVSSSLAARSIEDGRARKAEELANQRDILRASARTGAERQKIETRFNIAITKANEQAAKQRFATDKAFSISSAVINTALGVTKALATLPPPASYVTAAITAAAGIAQVTQIATQSFGSGGSVGGVPGAGEAQATIDEALDTQGIGGGREVQRETIVAIGDRGLDELIDAIGDRINSGDRILFERTSAQAQELGVTA